MNKLEELEGVLAQAKNDLDSIDNLNELQQSKANYLGKKGPIAAVMASMKDLSVEAKKELGMASNKIKVSLEELFENKKKYIEEKLIAKKLESETIDVTLPGMNIPSGSIHPLNRTIEELEDLYIGMGYTVAEGPEIETDEYCFEKLNLPKGHPARDMQDTFYINPELLLRSQTSPVQVRTMLKGKGEVPIRMICPGKTYRRDDDDASHSHQFVQIEGLLVDKDISLSDLKGTMDVLFKRLFGDKIETRFRPSYYQFTEPSVEVDITCVNCHGKGCGVCKHTGWVTVVGAGVVHPNVLRMSGYDPEVWSGFAFGFGAERLAMMKYDINDIRTFYNADLRETAVFDREDEE